MKKFIICSFLLTILSAQSEYTTKVYELNLEIGVNSIYELDLIDITGYNLEQAKIEYLNISNFTLSSGYTNLYLENEDIGWNNSESWIYSAVELNSYGGVNFNTNTPDVESVKYNGSNIIRLRTQSGSFSGTVSLLITAEFPEEDTGYIEEGFDYCIEEGANLIASPCRDTVPILDTLPTEIANNLTGIIGQGVAATYQDGNWMGSLSGLGGGNGYWFTSNVNACFNYNCSEN